MQPFDTADRTIRNQRVQDWPSLPISIGWAAVSAGFLLALWKWLPPNITLIYVLIPLLPSVIGFLRRIVLADRLPVQQLKLGDELVVVPARRYRLDEIGEIRFTQDNQEDYAESVLPIPICDVAIQCWDNRTINLGVSLGDATRIREWAKQKGISVIDVEGYSEQISREGSKN
jgi:hypothetical protein